MAFKIADYQDNMFFLDILAPDKSVLASYELRALTYGEWNEIGLRVVTDEAAPIKNETGSGLVPDIVGQRKLDGEAEILRNTMRLVTSLEGGEGIDWGESVPPTLEAKAKVMLNTDSSMVLSLLNGLRTRAYGKAVTAEDAEVRFQRLQAKPNASMQSDEDHD